LNRRLESLGLQFPFFAAPMVGLSHVSFRRLVLSYMAENCTPVLCTEMLSTRRIPDEKISETHQLKAHPSEKKLVIQILGNEEKYIAPSLQKLAAHDPFGFDINMGCPVSHTLKHNWGVRLMGDKHYAAEVVAMCKRNTHLPVSVKLRGSPGEKEDLDYLVEFTDALENAGVNWITIHPRPRAQKHKGNANWKLVEQVRARRSIPVVGNGDIQCWQEAIEAWETFAVDGVMVGRALTAKPWMLAQVQSQKFGSTKAESLPWSKEQEGLEFPKACLRLLEFMIEDFGDESFVLEKFCFFAATAARWYFHGHYFWKRTTRCKTVFELSQFLVEFCDVQDNHAFGRVGNL
jgi:tRNA-dihydrouridine synthase B